MSNKANTEKLLDFLDHFNLRNATNFSAICQTWIPITEIHYLHLISKFLQSRRGAGGARLWPNKFYRFPKSPNLQTTPNLTTRWRAIEKGQDAICQRYANELIWLAMLRKLFFALMSLSAYLIRLQYIINLRWHLGLTKQSLRR